jgi:glycosyltransferase involved in cell wall biosynthesis
LKFVFVTYRWGDDLLGGAEIHHRRLAQELVDLGHTVEVITSAGHQVSTFWHWGVEWTDEKAPPTNVPVKRLGRKRGTRYLLAAGAKALQMHMEWEEANLPKDLQGELAAQSEVRHGVTLLNGWHYPEIRDGALSRWTHPSAHVLLRSETPKATVIFRGHANHPTTLTLTAQGKELGSQRFQPGYVEFPVDLSAPVDGIATLTAGPLKRWAKDHRTLGIWLNSIELKAADKASHWTDFDVDFRSLGRQVPARWQAWLLDRARKRPWYWNGLFDRLRGPQVKGLAAALRAAKGDHVIHCNFPWGNMSAVREGDLAMPLWHIDDEFYYWQHWIDALKRARLVLANTPFTAESFFPPLGIKSRFVGPPIWEPTIPPPEVAAEFRTRHAIQPDEVLVLTVCRKSGEKRYDAVASAVSRLREEGVRIRMLGIGPDIDGVPLRGDGCTWLGKMGGDDLQAAYAACDIFALLSESESFGMVVPEAWHHGKPVVVNRLCQPVASLLTHGKEGLAVKPGAELLEAFRALALDPERRRHMGEAGRSVAQAHYRRGAAAARLIAALPS